MADVSGWAGEDALAGRAAIDFRALLARFFTFVRAAAARDAERLGLWAPVALGAGAAVYLGLRGEPPAYVAPVCLCLALAIALLTLQWRAIALGVAFFCLGFVVADLRASLVGAPVLDRAIGYAKLEGRLLSVEEAEKFRRLIIAVDSIEGLESAKTPARVRLSWRGAAFDALPGQRVSLAASLSPPPQPVTPGGYDFARHLYFLQIGAVGFAYSPPTSLADQQPTLASRAAGSIEQARLTLTRRILAAAPGDTGAIVAAVVTGKREAISDEAEAVFRDSGLTHLLSISGLHIGLATGIIFFSLRAGLSLIEPIALRYPIKKWAAVAAILSGAAYLALSGNAWPAQRSFLMTAVVYIAILADRRAFSLRNVAIAAFIILLLAPEAVANPGFQMSFAAVTALIAAYEWASARADPLRSFLLTARAGRYVKGIVATDIVSSLATSPFSLFHFNRASNFGLIANSVSIPLMGFWVMPLAIVALALMPFGLDGPVWRAAAAGVDAMLSLGAFTVGLPGAVTVFPKWPDAVLPVFAVGGLWLCLMTGVWRLAGLLALPLAALLIAGHGAPDIYVSASGENAAAIVRSEAGETLVVFDPRKDRFAARAFLEHAGLDERKDTPEPMRRDGFCDREGCVVPINGASVAFSNQRHALDDDCARASLVVALFPVSPRERQGCNAALIDRRDVWAEGAHSARLDSAAQPVIRSVKDRRGERAWARY